MERGHIHLTYPDSFPDSFGETVTSDITHDGLHIILKREEPKVWSSVEWMIPGLIAAYILKSYFEGFLKEAGKDHYILLKKCLNKLLKLTHDAPDPLVVSELSPNKLDKSNTQSKAISVYFELKDGTIVKLLFDNELALEDWIAALDLFMDLLNDHYSNYPNDELSSQLYLLQSMQSSEIYAIIDKVSMKWRLLDLRQIMKKM